MSSSSNSSRPSSSVPDDALAGGIKAADPTPGIVVDSRPDAAVPDEPLSIRSASGIAPLHASASVRCVALDAVVVDPVELCAPNGGGDDGDAGRGPPSSGGGEDGDADRAGCGACSGSLGSGSRMISVGSRAGGSGALQRLLLSRSRSSAVLPGRHAPTGATSASTGGSETRRGRITIGGGSASASSDGGYSSSSSPTNESASASHRAR